MNLSSKLELLLYIPDWVIAVAWYCAYALFCIFVLIMLFGAIEEYRLNRYLRENWDDVVFRLRYGKRSKD